MRLIDADELLTAFPVDNEPTVTKSCIRMTIQNMPTIEPKQGEWIETDSPYIWKCSECPCEVVGNSLEQYNFCPNCGARMKGEKNNG